MWLRFLAAFAVAGLVMYMPGYLFWRALRFGRILSLVCAPLASIAALVLMGIVFQKVGVPVDGVMLSGMTLAVGLLLFGISLFRFLEVAVVQLSFCEMENDPLRHGLRGRRGAWDLAIPDAAILALYIICGLIVCAWVFLANIGSPDAFFGRWDNQTHLSLVRAFLDSGQWSSLHTDQYLAAAPAAKPYLSAPGFYPAAWHVVVATVCSITGCGVAVGVNAVNSAFMGIVLPMSVFSFLRTSFPDNRMVVLAGAVAASGCSVFPWWFFATGPLYPNFAGMALVLASASAAIALLAGGLVRRKWVSVVLLASSSMISLALMHPNVLFYLLIVLAAYGTSHLFDFQKAAGHGTAVRIAGMVVYLVVICVFWYACFRLPFLQGVIRYPSKPKPGIIPALVNLAGMVAVEPVFALAASGGFVLCCHDRRSWLAVPAVFMGVACVASRLDPGGIGQAIGGFWYTDFRRLGSCFGFALIPLAAWGWAGSRSGCEDGVSPRLQGGGPW